MSDIPNEFEFEDLYLRDFEMLRQRRRGEFWLPEYNPDEISLPDDSCVCRERKMSTLVAAITVLGVWYILHSVALNLKNRLPPMVEIHDGHSEDRFVGENAKVFLEKLAKLGVKVPGSKAVEIDAVNLLEEEITKIINNKNTFNEVTYSQQKAIGSFHLAKPFNFMSVYNNITNLVVKIGPSEENGAHETSSLLVNCHYDSAPSSPGASDDGLNCAVMLEVLRVLSQQRYKLNHNIIFLFNGAEETPLQASHAFITQHKWASTVKAFINLESCGAGGKEALFQTGPQHPWLVQMYKEAAQHPFGLVLAEDLFQGGLVPSDTDFRIFRDFGHIPGLDFAHCDNGYVYHTKFDDIDKIEDGVYQHTGDNLLALVQRISSSEILDNTDKYKNGRTIYFDLGGLYLVTYSERFAYIINLAVVVISVFTIVKNVLYCTQDFYKIHKVLEQIIMCVLIPFIGLILSLMFVITIAVILDYTGSVLSWYSEPYDITLLYFLPTLIAFALPPLRLNAVESSILSDEVKAQLYCNGVQLMWTIGLLIATLTGIRSAYVLLIAVLFTAVTNLILWLLCLRYKVKAWLVFFCISSIPSSLYFVYIYLLATKLFVPIAGRSGPNINPELVIGVIAALLCSLIFSYISPLILMVRKPWRIVYGLLIVNLLTILAVIFTSRGFPFAENTPERLLVLHTGRTFYNKAGGIIKSDGGMWLMHIDRRAPETYHEIPWFKNVTDVDSDCSQYIYCGLPFYYTRIASTERNPGSWVPTSPPLLDIDTNLNLTYTENISVLVKRFHFTATGPHQMMFFLSPKQDVELLNWSFDKESPIRNIKWGERPTYVIHYTAGGYPDSPPFNFYVDLKIQSESSNFSSYLDIAVSGHYIEDMTKQKTDLMKSYTDSFLKWAHVTTWTALHRSYVF